MGLQEWDSKTRAMRSSVGLCLFKDPWSCGLSEFLNDARPHRKQKLDEHFDIIK